MLSTHHYHPALGQVMLARLMRAITPGSTDVEMLDLKTSVLRVAFRALTHSSVYEIKRTGHIQQKCALMRNFLPKSVTEKHGTGH